MSEPRLKIFWRMLNASNEHAALPKLTLGEAQELLAKVLIEARRIGVRRMREAKDRTDTDDQGKVP